MRQWTTKENALCLRYLQQYLEEVEAARKYKETSAAREKFAHYLIDKYPSILEGRNANGVSLHLDYLDKLTRGEINLDRTDIRESDVENYYGIYIEEQQAIVNGK